MVNLRNVQQKKKKKEKKGTQTQKEWLWLMPYLILTGNHVIGPGKLSWFFIREVSLS